MNLMFEPLRRYADFSGRSRRTEFWLFILFQWAVNIVLIVGAVGAGLTFAELGAMDVGSNATALGTGVVVMIIFVILLQLALIIPNLAVAARRMQDQDIPGWVGILLVLGGIFFTFPFLIMAVFGFIPGTHGRNKYGPDTKAENIADTFS